MNTSSDCNSLSIICFNYNYATYLPQALDSIAGLAQYLAINIIVLDDHSSDLSLDVIASFKLLNPQISVYCFRASTRRPKQDAYFSQLDGIRYIVNNYAHLLHAYVAFMDADDYYPRQSIRQSLSIFSRLSGDIVFLRVSNIFDATGAILTVPIKRYSDISKPPFRWPSIVQTSGLILSKSFLVDYFLLICTNSCLFRDLWLDSRIAILSSLPTVSTKYLDVSVLRRIHDSNDSRHGGFRILRLAFSLGSACIYFIAVHSLLSRTSLLFYIIRLPLLALALIRLLSTPFLPVNLPVSTYNDLS